MKQERFSKILKTRGFYLSLLTGVLAVAAICFVYFSTSGKNNTNNLTDLNNNPSQQQSANDNNANTPGEDGKDTVVKNSATPTPQGNQNTGKNDNKGSDNVVKENDVTKDPNSVAENEDKNDAVEAVQQGSDKTQLSYNQEEEMAWPVTGNVVIPYDMEHGVLFATLGQYKCSDAIVISSKVGTKVKSAVKGKVIDIAKNEETGLTVTADIGSGYTVTYGQLKNVKVKEGDILNTGDVIGVIAKPTKYYVVEGANLYFKVMQDEQPVNPMYLLK